MITAVRCPHCGPAGACRTRPSRVDVRTLSGPGAEPQPGEQADGGEGVGMIRTEAVSSASAASAASSAVSADCPRSAGALASSNAARPASARRRSLRAILRKASSASVSCARAEDAYCGVSARPAVCVSRAESPRFRAVPVAGSRSFSLTSPDQAARNASVTGSRAARRAGNRPPMRPMPSAHFRPFHSRSGETLNWNITWLKLELSVDTV